MSATTDWEAEFGDLATEFYPGTSKPIVRHANRVATKAPLKDAATWDSNPREYTVNGVTQEFFTVGALAQALLRRAVTIRKWEREGVIPRATFQAPSADPRGRRRLYSRPQIEGMIKIAREEGLLEEDNQKRIDKTHFKSRVIELFHRLIAEARA